MSKGPVMLLLFIMILITPIASWYATKHLGPKSKPKRFILWFVATWILELLVFITALAT